MNEAYSCVKKGKVNTVLMTKITISHLRKTPTFDTLLLCFSKQRFPTSAAAAEVEENMGAVLSLFLVLPSHQVALQEHLEPPQSNENGQKTQKTPDSVPIDHGAAPEV